MFCSLFTSSQRNSKWALERAKANVMKWYPVIGVLDLIDETLNVLESTFPQFFEGAKLVYEKLSTLKKFKLHDLKF